MFKIDDTNIQITRGDTGVIVLSTRIEDEDKDYVFKVGDVIQLKVFEKKHVENIVLQKRYTIDEESASVELLLSSEDTKIGELINKRVDYWYEIELNPEWHQHTIIGYDDDGPKIFSLYPEGGDLK